jgi:hypothetical protein
VHCKISGLGMTDPRFTRESLRRWVQTCVEVFGPDRCVLGSNWPVDRLFSSYDVIVDLYRDYLSDLGDEEQRSSSPATRSGSTGCDSGRRRHLLLPPAARRGPRRGAARPAVLGLDGRRALLRGAGC